MEITKELAAQIVDAIYEVVKKDINLIDASGVIIGSTDQSRIGDFHEAGAYVVAHNEAVSVDDRHPFRGAKNGINYPIAIDGKVLAAIGITGNPEMLKAYGFLIIKITEVFLKEKQLNEEKLDKNRALHYLITSLIYGDSRDRLQLDALIEEYGLHRDEEYAVLSIKMKDPSVERSLGMMFRSAGCILYTYLYPNECVVVLDRAFSETFSPEKFSEKYHEQVYAGLGDFRKLYEISKSYANAKLARKHAESHCLEYYDIRDVSAEYVLESIPYNTGKIFRDRILKDLTEREIQLLKNYFENNLSLKETAALLYIHKNTLQYQLDKIEDKTGLNPRVFSDAFLIKMALFLK